ncbi:YibE/F family protein [Staphylococcus pseudintermedius]|uniref:YibE/F family protein n=1 Tax=Staphylococcus pseudintermedius TaxID=283734 RepID=UPI000C1C481A|nr:YibE/F family protein [Staphylococcus pseudintermedius]EGQ0371815.1 YibE/F family protein [Staphylococcus pseudintermedius]EGQ3194466.1 YibE/F family protein [Staphylococcus pseudintermedius]EGQ3461310.1 YibE/F family protein [Staphylococcus pseudintermedius]EGQ3548735.1 YibE/F family protein [Staphylococcus pseudintermedius]EGQ3567495.1 YibE/F family protein [Staphylococcus pseudintermedius]
MKQLSKKINTIVIVVSIIVAICAIVFTRLNSSFYHNPLGEVTKIESHHQEKSVDEQHNQDVKYKDVLQVKLLNTKQQGDTLHVEHRYNASKTEEQAYQPGDKVLLHKGKNQKDTYIIEKKRDTVLVTVISAFFIALLIVGQRIGIQSILSLVINAFAILLAISLYHAYPQLNLFLLMSLAVMIATILTLWLVIGWSMRTIVTIVSTLLGTFICIFIAWSVIGLTHGQGIKYETMSFLTIQPRTVFLTSVMVGTLGAVMDVAITISSGMYEVLQRSPHISMQRWVLAGRNIGRDIMGTMTNILLFSYLAGSLPMLLLYLKNGNTLTYSISMNWSLEISRAITGGIGIVLTIPLTIFLMRIWLSLRGGATR